MSIDIKIQASRILLLKVIIGEIVAYLWHFACFISNRITTAGLEKIFRNSPSTF